MKVIEVTGTVVLDDDGDWSDADTKTMLDWLTEVTAGQTLASDMRANGPSRRLSVTTIALEAK